MREFGPLLDTYETRRCPNDRLSSAEGRSTAGEGVPHVYQFVMGRGRSPTPMPEIEIAAFGDPRNACVQVIGWNNSKCQLNVFDRLQGTPNRALRVRCGAPPGETFTVSNISGGGHSTRRSARIAYKTGIEPAAGARLRHPPRLAIAHAGPNRAC